MFVMKLNAALIVSGSLEEDNIKAVDVLLFVAE